MKVSVYVKMMDGAYVGKCFNTTINMLLVSILLINIRHLLRNRSCFIT